MQSGQRWPWRWLRPDVRRHERPRLAFFASLGAALSFGQTLGLAGSESLFLSELGAASLPSALVVAAVVAAVASGFYAAAVGSLNNDRLFTIMLVGGAALLGVVAMIPDRMLSLYALFAAYFATQAVFVVHLRTFAVDYFDTLSSKRLLPLIAAGGSLGGVAAGLLGAALASGLGPRSLIVGWGASLLATGLFIAMRQRQLRGWRAMGVSEADESAVSRIRGAIRHLRGPGLARSLLLLVVTLVLALSLLHFVSSVIIVERFPDPTELATFLAVYLAIGNVVEIVLARWVTPRVVRALSVPTSQILHPILSLMMFGGVALAPGLPAAVAARANRETLENAFSGEIRNLAYNALPVRLRGATRALLEAGVYYSSYAIGGLALIAMGPDMPLSSVALLGGVVAALYLLAALRVRRTYVREMISGLVSERLELGDLTEQLDPGSLDRLVESWRESLADLDGRPALRNQLELARVFTARGLGALVATQTTHPDPAVRRACLDALAAAQDVELAGVIPRALEDPDARVRGSAARALVAVQWPWSEALRAAVARAASDPSAEVRAAACVHLGSQGRQQLALEATDPDPAVAIPSIERLGASELGLLQDRLSAAAPEIRAAVLARLEAMGEGARVPTEELTGRHLSDPSHDVRLAALRLLAQRDGPAIVSVLAGCLADPSEAVGMLARDALARRGEAGLRAARASLASHDPNEADRAIDLFARSDDNAAWAVLREEARRRALAAWRSEAACQLVADKPELPLRLLCATFEDKKRRDIGRVLAITAALAGSRVVDSIDRVIRFGSPTLRADALELLTLIGDRVANEALALLLEEGDFEEKRASASFRLDAAETLDELIAQAQASDDPWLRRAGQIAARDITSLTQREIEEMERLIALRQVPLFAQLGLDHLNAISQRVVERSFARGEVVMRQGDLARELFVVLSGEVVAYVSYGEPGELQVGQFKTADCFGEIALIDGAPRSATLVVAEDARLLTMDGGVLPDLLREVPEMASDLMQGLARKIRLADQRATRLAAL